MMNQLLYLFRRYNSLAATQAFAYHCISLHHDATSTLTDPQLAIVAIAGRCAAILGVVSPIDPAAAAQTTTTSVARA